MDESDEQEFLSIRTLSRWQRGIAPSSKEARNLEWESMNYRTLCSSRSQLDALPTFALARHFGLKQEHRKSRSRVPLAKAARLRRFSSPPTILSCSTGYSYRIVSGDSSARPVGSKSKEPTNLQAVPMTTDNTRTGQSAIEKVFAMQRGSGEASYAKNSSQQEFIVKNFVVPELFEAVDNVTLPDDGQPMVVADLGCASGSNTINNMNIILNRLKERIVAAAAGVSNSSTKLPEFHVFFNDLPSNDFNNLFQLLSEQRDSLDYFVGGVPGSFYGRLFPRSSVHIFFSSHCLHWMSTIPQTLADKNSPAFNKGDMWIMRGRSEIVAAYKEQADLDLRNFLNARAEEMIPGGLLFLIFNGRVDPDPVEQFPKKSFTYGVWKCMDEAWDTMVAQGHITEDQRDAYNVPLYNRSVQEVREAVESCGSAFRVQKVTALESVGNSKVGNLFIKTPPSEMSKRTVLFMESLHGPLVEAHIGKELARVYWENVQVRMLETDVHGLMLTLEKESNNTEIGLNIAILIRS